ncbi:MAG: YegP family protein [Actinobacteria bacterium]|nr:YegP family protein [Actinomycetota bacterium]
MDRLLTYEDASDEFRWKKVARNGDLIAESGESYTRKEDAERAALRSNPEFQSVEYEEAEE